MATTPDYDEEQDEHRQLQEYHAPVYAMFGFYTRGWEGPHPHASISTLVSPQISGWLRVFRFCIEFSIEHRQGFLRGLQLRQGLQQPCLDTCCVNDGYH